VLQEKVTGAHLNPRRHAAGKPFPHAFLTGWLAGTRLAQIQNGRSLWGDGTKIMERRETEKASLKAHTWPQDVVIDLPLPSYLWGESCAGAGFPRGS
jgi:hypothetical protein